MIRHALLFAVLCVAPAAAQPSLMSKLEVVGNHAGRMMKLHVDGKLVFEGNGHLDPPGVIWTLDIAPGTEPAPIELTIEPCEAPFKVDVPRNGGVHTLIIQGCDVKIVRG